MGCPRLCLLHKYPPIFIFDYDLYFILHAIRILLYIAKYAVFMQKSTAEPVFSGTFSICSYLEAGRIKRALSDNNNVLDRSIYEDSLLFHLPRAQRAEVRG